MKSFFYFLSTVFFINLFSLLAQTPQQINTLMQIANEQKVIADLERQQAISLANRVGIPIRKVFEDGTVMELQRFKNNIPQYFITNNLTSANTISTSKLWTQGSVGIELTGQNITLGIWDEARVRAEHQELQGRVVQMDNPQNLSNHATHVAGTMMASGVVNEAHGMSYQANLHAYDWNSDLSEMAEAAANGLRVSNHSYGYITGWYYNLYGDGKWVWFGDVNLCIEEDASYGSYAEYTRQQDEIAYNAPNYLIVRSAGNDRGRGPATQPIEHWVYNNGNIYLSEDIRQKGGGDDGFDCITYDGISKNILTVGAVYGIPNGYSEPSDVVMSWFSSWGPTDDGRVKPDLVADGVGLYSSMATSNTAYASLNGTSMASPSITGSIGLILEYWENNFNTTAPLSSTIKGLLIHTADATGVSNGPDYIYGWGLMNTAKAVELLKNEAESTGGLHIQEITLQNNETIEFEIYANGAEPLITTIAWTDPAGIVPEPALNPQDLILVNDLDIRIIDMNGNIFLPYILDPANPNAAANTGDNFRDNVEKIFLINPAKGTYLVSITHKNTLENDEQTFSLIISGNYIPETPELIAPQNVSEFITRTPIFEWTVVDYVDYYELSIYNTENERILEYFEIIDPYYYSDGENITFQLNEAFPLEYYSSFEWNVVAVSGNIRMETEYFSFTTSKAGGAIASNLPNVELCKNSNETFFLGEYKNDFSTTVVGGSGDYTYTWSPTAGLKFSNGIENPIINPLTSINYTLKVVDNETNATLTSNVSVSINKVPIIMMSPLVMVNAFEPIDNLNDFATIKDGQGFIEYYWNDASGFEVNPENYTPSLGVTQLFLNVIDENECQANTKRLILYATLSKDLPQNNYVAGLNEKTFMWVNPIPANEYIDITVLLTDADSGLITLIDMSGREILSIEINGNTQIEKQLSLSALSAGTYFLILDTADDMLLHKIIKQ